MDETINKAFHPVWAVELHSYRIFRLAFSGKRLRESSWVGEAFRAAHRDDAPS